jgi:uncharacterized protein (TIGR02268 family)
LAQPVTWLLLAPLLVASAAAAQPSPPARQRQDRHLWLSALAEQPPPEVRIAAGNLTTLVFTDPLEPDSLEVDRARFKLADVGEHILTLEPTTELGPGERLLVKVRFKDRAAPAQALIALVSHPSEMDGKVEVERQVSTPEALRLVLSQKEAELEQLKAQCEADSSPRPVLSEGPPAGVAPRRPGHERVPAEASGLRMERTWSYRDKSSTVLTAQVLNLPSHAPWVLGQARLTGPNGEPVPVLTASMTPAELAPGQRGQVQLEVKSSWETHRVELMDPSGQRHLSFTLPSAGGSPQP